jgi:pimeloyl-ACP methyl ester carboxylesterase
MELFIPVAGGEIWAEDTGGDGAPLVFIHPGWGDSSIWSPVLTELDGRYRTIRYDDRAYGRSPAPAAPFAPVDDLRSVLDHLGVERAGVVAHSGGGGTALALALASQERVRSVVLVAPGVQDYPWPADDPYIREGARCFADRDRDGLVVLGLRTWARADPGPAARAQVNSAVTAMLAMGPVHPSEPPVYGRLAEVRAPAVMVRGDLEYPMVTEAADRIAARVPGCQHVVIPGADHLLPLRAPAELAAIIGQLNG